MQKAADPAACGNGTAPGARGEMRFSMGALSG
jgi:hypothetical protein